MNNLATSMEEAGDVVALLAEGAFVYWAYTGKSV